MSTEGEKKRDIQYGWMKCPALLSWGVLVWCGGKAVCICHCTVAVHPSGKCAEETNLEFCSKIAWGNNKREILSVACSNLVLDHLFKLLVNF